MPERGFSGWVARQWQELLAAARALLRWPAGLYSAGLVLAVAGLLAFAGVAAGLAPVNASAGHWAVTRVLLHWAMERATRMRAHGVVTPDGKGAADRLDTPDALARRGAGHYATACLACHGGPGHPRSEVALHMTPEPPWLPETLEKWNRRELFHIVRHGVKYTAMPAWPSDRRDDEVWAMVEFLQRMPDMPPEVFARLTAARVHPLQPQALDELSAPAGPSSAITSVDEASSLPAGTLAGCARCHGFDGRGDANGAFPRLDRQHEAYLLASLRAFARGERHSGIMEPAVRGLDDDQLRALARHYASRTSQPTATNGALDPDSIRRGHRLAHEGDPRRRIPACVQCHGPGKRDRNPSYPRLAGQYPAYLARQLELFQSHSRGGAGNEHLMHLAAHALQPGDIHDLASYYGSLH